MAPSVVNVYAVIVAGGKGLRMGSDIPKQYLDLDGVPVLVHTLKTFTALSFIEKIVLVVPRHYLEHCRDKLLRPFGMEQFVIPVAGGEERQNSVENGLTVVLDIYEKTREFKKTDSSPIVLIHDGVRPLADEALIRRCLSGALTYGACIPVLPVTDTLVQGKDNFVEHNVDRSHFFRVQTPQAFELNLIREAHLNARKRGIASTDDASLVRFMGRQIYFVPGSETNFKITTPEDLELARFFVCNQRP